VLEVAVLQMLRVDLQLRASRHRFEAFPWRQQLSTYAVGEAPVGMRSLGASFSIIPDASLPKDRRRRVDGARDAQL
jgi:hypothetical protein